MNASASTSATLPLLEGDSAIGHLNNALQILTMLRGSASPVAYGPPALGDVERRIELAVKLLAPQPTEPEITITAKPFLTEREYRLMLNAKHVISEAVLKLMPAHPHPKALRDTWDGIARFLTENG